MPGPSEAYGHAGPAADPAFPGEAGVTGSAAVPSPPPDPDAPPPAPAVPGHVHAAPTVRAHWAVLAAGLVCLALQAWLQSRPVMDPDAEWLYFVIMVVYVLSVALIAAGIVGWLLSRYLRALLTAPAAPVELDEEPVGDEGVAPPPPPHPSPAPSARPGRVPAPTAWRPTARSDAPAEDDHSLWRR